MAGLATGVAALGAVFQHHLATTLQAQLGHPAAALAKTLSAAGIRAAEKLAPTQPHVLAASRHAFVSGTNEILTIGSILVLLGALTALLLVRARDFHGAPKSAPALGADRDLRIPATPTVNHLIPTTATNKESPMRPLHVTHRRSSRAARSLRMWLFCLVLVGIAVGAAGTAAAASGPQGYAAVIAGRNTSIYPQGVAVDSAGNVYVATGPVGMVEKVTPTGAVSPVAGDRTIFSEFTGAIPGPATSTGLLSPQGVAVDSAGNLYIADTADNEVVKVTPDGTLSIIAGQGPMLPGAPTPGPATSSNLWGPQGVAVDSAGNVYIADTDNNTIDKVTPDGTLSIIAGQDVFHPGPPTPGPATSSDLWFPTAVAVDSAGNVYIADTRNDEVEKVTPDGTLSIIAGEGHPGTPTPGPATSSRLEVPSGVAVDSAGNVYISSSYDQAVYSAVVKVTPGGTLSIIAGNGANAFETPGPATSSSLYGPEGLAVDGSGNVYIADTGNDAVEKVTPGGTLSVIAGIGPLTLNDPTEAAPPTPGPATSSNLGYPWGVAVDGSGNVYTADGFNNEIEKVTPDGTLSIIAGTGSKGPPTPGPATSSQLNSPHGVAVDSAGNLYIADTFNNEVEKVTPDGTLSIIAGTGSQGPPTPGPATSSQLSLPGGVAVDSAGNVYIADTGNEEIEKVAPGGTLSIIAGNGSQGPPIPGPATSSHFLVPEGVAVDGAGNVYIADTENSTVEKVTPGGTLSVIAGCGGPPGPPVRGPATKSCLGYPRGVGVDSAGNVYIADTFNNTIDKVTPDGTLSIIDGLGYGDFSPVVPGAATESGTANPAGVAVDSAGNIYIADPGYSDVDEGFGPPSTAGGGGAGAGGGGAGAGAGAGGAGAGAGGAGAGAGGAGAGGAGAGGAGAGGAGARRRRAGGAGAGAGGAGAGAGGAGAGAGGAGAGGAVLAVLVLAVLARAVPVRARAVPVRARAVPVRARAVPVLVLAVLVLAVLVLAVLARAVLVRARAVPVRARAVLVLAVLVLAVLVLAVLVLALLGRGRGLRRPPARRPCIREARRSGRPGSTTGASGCAWPATARPGRRAR